MRRLPALLLATLVLALPAQAAEPAPRVKNTKGEIESIAMDGPRVAYAVKSDTCTKVIVLNVLTRSAAVASGPKTCDADNSSTGAGVREIALAGARLAWIVNQGGNSEGDDCLSTATLGSQSLYAVSLDLHRVAVLRTDHTVAIYDTETRRQLLTLPPACAQEIALRKDDLGIHAVCCGPNMWQANAGSGTVFINGKAAHRKGDATKHCGGQGKLIQGSDDVIVGG